MNTCQECKAILDDGKSCSDYFNQMIAWDFSDFSGAGQVHHLTVLCYYIQHPKKYSKKALHEAKEIIKDIVVGSMSIDDLYKKESEVFSSSKRDWIVRGTEDDYGTYKSDIKWSYTAADVIKGGIDNYIDNVKKWASSIYSDLSSHGEYS